MDPMKRLPDIAARMEKTIQAENTPTSSSLDDSSMQPLTIACYDPDYPDQPCPICRGMGVIKYAVQPGDPRFGKLFRCPNNPVEDDTIRKARLRKLSNLDAFADKTLDNFRVYMHTYTERELVSLRDAHQLACIYAENPDGWLFFQGGYGTGKTHLAAAVGNERLKRGDAVLFITTPDLLDHLRSTYASNNEMNYDELFYRLRNTKILILDDLGTENPSEWAKEKLFQLLNHRYSHNMATVITTNANLDELDPRISSRLIASTHSMFLEVPDYRKTTANTRSEGLSHLRLYQDMTFHSFEIDVNSPEAENLLKAAQAAEDYAQNRPENQIVPWFLLMGPYGTGKTHLAAAIAHYRNGQRQEVLFVTVPDLLDHLRTTFTPDSNTTFDHIFNQVRNVQLLVLDDLGTESVKPWTQEKLFQILDYRYVGRKATVITTARKLEDLNERIVSRLLDEHVCRKFAITGRPYAKRMKRG